MPDKKKVLVVQNIHKKGIELLKNHPNFEFEIIDAEEMVDKIDPELFKKKILFIFYFNINFFLNNHFHNTTPIN